MKNIIITFDYELFFGDKSGTVIKSIIQPTNDILTALEKVNGKAVFFVDYLMLKRMHAENDITHHAALLIEEQLRDIVRRGSRIELHLHPHWIDAKYKNGEWDFSDFTHYCMESFSDEEAHDMIVEGTRYLESIVKNVDPNYKIIAFRAGGWAILPFCKFANGFKDAGIIVDSSVTKQRIIEGYTHTMDFRLSPNEIIYKFRDDVLCPVRDGVYVEHQIATVQFNIFSYIIDALYRKMNPLKFKRLTDGTHVLQKYEKRRHQVQEYRQGFFKKLNLSRFYMRTFLAITDQSKYGMRLLLKKCKSVPVIMGHPKDLTLATIENIEYLGKYYKCVSYNELLNFYEL